MFRVTLLGSDVLATGENLFIRIWSGLKRTTFKS